MKVGRVHVYVVKFIAKIIVVSGAWAAAEADGYRQPGHGIVWGKVQTRPATEGAVLLCTGTYVWGIFQL